MILSGLDCLSPVYVKIPSDKQAELILPVSLGSGHRLKSRLRVPCGTCINCRTRRVREWCLRLAMESHYWSDISFVTLTYNDLHVPVNVETDVYTLYKRDLQLFIKRLRKNTNKELKYYAVGEYGTKRGRPHYHLIVFGLSQSNYPDVVDSWRYGFIDCRPFYPETTAYVAGYVQKKLYGSESIKDIRLPEFMCCSHHLGERWLMDNLDTIDDDHLYIPYQGYNHAVPRTFLKKLIALGRVSPVNWYDLLSEQTDAYYDAIDKCKAKDCTISDVIAQRWADAISKRDRYLSSRNKNDL